MENYKPVPMGHTLVRNQKEVPQESMIKFGDKPKLITALLELPVYF